jgi:DNA polymerase III alpha subunit
MKKLALWKSHYSLGRSILTLDAAKDKSGKPNTNSIFHLLNSNGLKTLTLVEDNISGLLDASKQAADNKIKLIFGLRLAVTEDISIKDENSSSKEAKYIIFAKNTDGYKDLVKIWSLAAQDGFYYHPIIDFKNLQKLWTNNLMLVVPFYDSFLHLNLLESHIHVPNFSFTKPTFLLEDNGIPFDDILENKTKEYCKNNDLKFINAQSVFYENPEDFSAYLTFRCIHARGSAKKSTCDKPELNHMCSNQFNFQKIIK